MCTHIPCLNPYVIHFLSDFRVLCFIWNATKNRKLFIFHNFFNFVKVWCIPLKITEFYQLFVLSYLNEIKKLFLTVAYWVFIWNCITCQTTPRFHFNFRFKTDGKVRGHHSTLISRKINSTWLTGEGNLKHTHSTFL